MVICVLVIPVSTSFVGVQVTSHKQKLRQSVARGEVPGARRIGVTDHYAGRRSRREVKRRPKRYLYATKRKRQEKGVERSGSG